MTTIVQSKTILLLRFDKHDEVITGLSSVAMDTDITAASFTAIGAAKELILSYYNLETKTYEDHVFQEDVEITGIIGNIGRMDDKIVIHAHGTFGRRDMSVVGGHVKKLVVSATCEVILTIIEGNITRAYDEETGLNLIKDVS